MPFVDLNLRRHFLKDELISFLNSRLPMKFSNLLFFPWFYIFGCLSIPRMKKVAGFPGHGSSGSPEEPGFETQKHEVHKSQAYPAKDFKIISLNPSSLAGFFGKFFTIKRKYLDVSLFDEVKRVNIEKCIWTKLLHHLVFYWIYIYIYAVFKHPNCTLRSK